MIEWVTREKGEVLLAGWWVSDEMDRMVYRVGCRRADGRVGGWRGALVG